MSLSIIIPTLDIDNLRILFKSMQNFNKFNNSYEILVINQSNKNVFDLTNQYNLKINEIKPINKLSAPQARNYGAKFAKYDNLLFLDDDCLFYDLLENDIFNLLSILNENNFIYFSRGYINSNTYCEHYSLKGKINDFNFNKHIIEWNFVLNKDLFNKMNGFDDIGPGSKHFAHSGEAFIFYLKMKSYYMNIIHYPQFKIAHPNLLIHHTNKNKLIKYNYGNGFSIGVSLKNMNIITFFYWLSRLHFSFLKDKKYFYYRLLGFYDFLLFKRPRIN